MQGLSSQPKSPSTDDATLQRRLSENLARWAFTDFEQAKYAFDELKGLVTPRSPFDIRLSYHRSAAFLENQWYRYEDSLEHARTVVSILESLADGWALAETWADIAGTYLNQRNWSAAEDALERAKRHLGEDAPARARAYVTCREGFFFLKIGNHRKALGCLMEAQKEFLEWEENGATLKDWYIKTLILSGLGELYEYLGEEDKSQVAYRSVLPIVEKHKLRPRLAWHYLNAGRTALARNDAENAQLHFEKVLTVVGSGEEEVKTLALSNLGIMATISGNAPKALNLFGQAAADYNPPQKPSDFTNLSKIESWSAGLYLQLENLLEAEQHFLRAWEIGRQGNDLYHLASVSQQLSALYESTEQYEQAFKWQSQVTELNQEHFSSLRDNERQELEARHQLERSRQESQMARLRVAGLQLRALRAQMNPHFMFNSLNAIQGLVTSGRNNEAESYLAKFAKMMRHTLEYSELEEVSLEQEIEFLERYLDINRKLRFRDRLDFQIILPKNGELDELFIPTMIVQPFVENAIEHGLRPRQEGRLTIRFDVMPDDEYLLRCTIEDDGVGFNKGQEKAAALAGAGFQKHRSRGMEITHERLQLLHQIQKRPGDGFIQIYDLADLTNGQRTGTRVEVLLPILNGE